MVIPLQSRFEGGMVLVHDLSLNSIAVVMYEENIIQFWAASAVFNGSKRQFINHINSS